MYLQSNKMKFLFISASLLLSTFIGSAQQSNALENIRQNTLDVLRDFRDSIKNIQNSTAADSLVGNTITIMDITNTLNDSAQLKGILNYFSIANKAFKNNIPKRQLQVIANVNNDLQLKLTPDSSLTALGMESDVSFFEDQQVKVNVLINGDVPATKKYILFWATYLGEDQEEMIRSNKSEGFSDKFTLPCSLLIKLPAFVTFWLQDTKTLALYKSVPVFKIMETGSSDIDINFIPLK
jgi:hypothetical protein